MVELFLIKMLFLLNPEHINPDIILIIIMITL